MTWGWTAPELLLPAVVVEVAVVAEPDDALDVAAVEEAPVEPTELRLLLEPDELDELADEGIEAAVPVPVVPLPVMLAVRMVVEVVLAVLLIPAVGPLEAVVPAVVLLSPLFGPQAQRKTATTRRMGRRSMGMFS